MKAKKIRNQNDLPVMENGRISTEVYNEYVKELAAAEYEEGREAREAYTAKKKIAFDELIALGVSVESARLMSNYEEEVEE